MPQLKLISFNLCPFVQRSVITLREKDVPYEIEYIDLSNKPDWFLKISPFGKVPVLKVDDTVLFESAVINEYIDETTSDPRLHPSDPLRRAHNRAWIEFGSSMLADGYQLQFSQAEEDGRAAAERLRDKLSRLEEQVQGPWFNGDTFSLVDAAIAPALQRMMWSQNLEPSLALFEIYPRVTAWRDALLERPSVVASLPEGIEEIFTTYVRARGGWLVA